MGALGPLGRGSLYGRSVAVVGTTLWRDGILGGIEAEVNPNPAEMKLPRRSMCQPCLVPCVVLVRRES
jgi:hypothetical protein